VSYRFRDLLALEPLSAAEISFLLDQSKPFQEIQRHPLKKLATLRGKTVALAFFENSTRTRISFNTAASRLGADTMNLQAEASSLKKGETLLDTAVQSQCDEARLPGDAPLFLWLGRLRLAPPGHTVVNAGDGTHEHPSQGLLDALTIRDRKGSIENLNVTSSAISRIPRVAAPTFTCSENLAAASRCAAPPCGFRANWKK
jgi:aspartate carbamoyltransferase catalytic subunit